MPRRGAPSRQQQAFLSLLDQQYAVSGQPSDQSYRPSSNKHHDKASEKQQTRTNNIPGFKLRVADSPARSDSHCDAARQLQAIFDHTYDLETIQAVLTSCQGSVESATDMLLAMTATQQPDSSSSAAQSPSSCYVPVEAAVDASYWGLLPEECKGLVLKHLSSQDLAKAARTCKEFAEHIRQVRAGLGVLNIPSGLSAAAVRGMVQAYTGAKTVSLARCAGQLRHAVDFENMFRAVSQGGRARTQGQPLEKLNLKGCIALRDDDVTSLCSSFDTLRGVSLDRCEDITDAAIICLSKYKTAHVSELAALNDLSLQQAVGQAAIVRQGHLQTLQKALLASNFTAAQQAAAPRNPNAVPHSQPPAVHHQQQQSIMSSSSATDSNAQDNHQQGSTQRGLGSQGLQSLSLSGCYKVTDKGIAALQRGSPASKSLTCLDISGCPKLTAAALEVSPKAVLRHLTANSCHDISSVTIQLPSSSPLQTLSFTGCRKLKLVYISAPQLQDLSIDSNPQLHSLELQCPGLISLSASKCGSLSGFAALECPALQQLNLFGCRQLQTEDTEDILQALLGLAKLNINGCICLSRLDLPDCSQLTWLDCSGCASLHHISLASPVLSSLRAVACQRLVDVSLQSRKLLELNMLNCCMLQSITYPELDAALAQQLATGDTKPATRRARRKGSLSLSTNITGCNNLPDTIYRVLS